MPTWGGILKELQEMEHSGEVACFDIVRRKYLSSLYSKTGRNTILYSSKWTQAGKIDADLVSIIDEDIQGLMEVIHGLTGSNLDLILHSPGGSPEATEAFVSYLRTKFDDIRVIVPQAAMSAATMIACASDRIVMGKHSSLGPIDPQMILQTPLGVKAVPAHAILEQFNLAKAECEDPRKLGSWLPILGQYGPALLIECQNALDLSKELVSQWLKSYMFKSYENSEQISSGIADRLADHRSFKSHGLHINRDMAKQLGLIIENLEEDQELQDIVLSIFHATSHTFGATNAVKIIENHQGKAFIKQQQLLVLRQGPQPQNQNPQS